MKGFDAEFANLDQYIRVITDRVWEGRRIDDIRRYYGDDCAVESPSSVSIGLEPVMESTRATLRAFPDRRLLAEDVIISGDEEAGFLSSHRIFSPMTHAGDGVFGPATQRPVYVRTIADCVCLNNRIVHEWLVRDQAAIARQIGLLPRDVAQSWIDRSGGWNKGPMPLAPTPYQSFIDPHPLAQRYAQELTQIWEQQDRGFLERNHAATCISCLPAGNVAVGSHVLIRFWTELSAPFEVGQTSIEHLVANERSGRATAIAARWRARLTHSRPGRFGAPSGHPVEILGISHGEYEGGQLVREWHLIDEIAIWMQILTPRTAEHGTR